MKQASTSALVRAHMPPVLAAELPPEIVVDIVARLVAQAAAATDVDVSAAVVAPGTHPELFVSRAYAETFRAIAGQRLVALLASLKSDMLAWGARSRWDRDPPYWDVFRFAVHLRVSPAWLFKRALRGTAGGAFADQWLTVDTETAELTCAIPAEDWVLAPYDAALYSWLFGIDEAALVEPEEQADAFWDLVAPLWANSPALVRAIDLWEELDASEQQAALIILYRYLLPYGTHTVDEGETASMILPGVFRGLLGEATLPTVPGEAAVTDVWALGARAAASMLLGTVHGLARVWRDYDGAIGSRSDEWYELWDTLAAPTASPLELGLLRPLTALATDNELHWAAWLRVVYPPSRVGLPHVPDADLRAGRPLGDALAQLAAAAPADDDDADAEGALLTWLATSYLTPAQVVDHLPGALWTRHGGPLLEAVIVTRRAWPADAGLAARAWARVRGTAPASVAADADLVRVLWDTLRRAPAHAPRQRPRVLAVVRWVDVPLDQRAPLDEWAQEAHALPDALDRGVPLEGAVWARFVDLTSAYVYALGRASLADLVPHLADATERASIDLHEAMAALLHDLLALRPADAPATIAALAHTRGHHGREWDAVVAAIATLPSLANGAYDSSTLKRPPVHV